MFEATYPESPLGTFYDKFMARLMKDEKEKRNRVRADLRDQLARLTEFERNTGKLASYHVGAAQRAGQNVRRRTAVQRLKLDGGKEFLRVIVNDEYTDPIVTNGTRVDIDDYWLAIDDLGVSERSTHLTRLPSDSQWNHRPGTGPYMYPLHDGIRFIKGRGYALPMPVTHRSDGFDSAPDDMAYRLQLVDLHACLRDIGDSTYEQYENVPRYI